MTPEFDPYHKWLGIPPHEQPANHYRLLGISLFEIDPDVVEHAADRQMSHLRTHTNGPNAPHSQKLLNEISAAKLCLLNPAKRGEYDAQLRAQLAPPPPATPQPVYVQPVAQYAPQPYAPQQYAPQQYAPQQYAPQQYAPQAYAPQTYARPPIAAAVAYEQPQPEPENIFTSVATAENNQTFRRSRRAADLPLWAKIAGQITASVAGLAGGYAILCWLGPQYDVLGLMSRPAEVPGSATAGDSPKTSSAGGATTQPPADVPPSNSTNKKPIKPAGTKPSSKPPSRQPGTTTSVSTSSDSIDLLKLSDPKRDRVRGEWKLSGGVLDSPKALTQSRMELQAPVPLPDEYQLTVVATRQANGGPWKSLVMGLLSEGKQFQVMLDTNGQNSGVENADGKPFRDNSSTHRGQVFKDGIPATVIYTVNRRQVRVTVDGKPIIDWSGNLAGLGVQEIWKTPHPDRLFIGCDSTYRFSQISMRPLARQSSTTVASTVPVPSLSPSKPSNKVPKKRPPPRTLGDLLQPQPKRSTPTAADRKSAEKSLREELKNDFAKAKKDYGEQSKLAKKLLNRARGSSGKAAEVFACLDLAIELAGSAADIKTADDAVEELDSQYKDVDVLARKEEMLKDAIKRAKLPDDFKTVAEHYRRLLNRAIQEDKYDAAVKFGTKAQDFARKSKDDVFVKLLGEGVKELRVMQSAYDEVRASREKLEQSTDDTEACRQWGRFLCVYKNDWDNGRTLWCQAAESDPLAGLAGEDLDSPKSAADQAKLADRWWQAADDEQQSLPQRMLRERAIYWYRLSLPSLSASEKTRVESRLKEHETAQSAFPRGKWVDVLQLVDLNRNKSAGNWVRRGDDIGIKDAPDDARFSVPVAPSGSYDLEIQFTIVKNHDVTVVLPIDDHQCLVLLNGWDGTVSGIGDVRGFSDIRESPTAYKHKRLALNQRHRLQISVISAKDNVDIKATLNDQPWVKYSGPAAAINLHNHWRLTNANVLGLGTYRTDMVFHAVKLRINTGSARLVTD